MDAKLILLVVSMLACNADAVTDERISKCVAEVIEAFEGYVIPESVSTATQTVSSFLDESTDDDDKIALSNTLRKDDCEAHIEEVKRRTSQVPCHKELSMSRLSKEYEDTLYDNKMVTDATLGAQLCEGFLRTLS